MDNISWSNGGPPFATAAIGFGDIIEERSEQNKGEKKPYTEAEIEAAMNRYRDGERSEQIMDIISWRSE